MAIVRLIKAQSGAAVMEYGLIAALVVLVVVGGMTATGSSVGDLYEATLAFIGVALAG